MRLSKANSVATNEDMRKNKTLVMSNASKHVKRYYAAFHFTFPVTHDTDPVSVNLAGGGALACFFLLCLIMMADRLCNP